MGSGGGWILVVALVGPAVLAAVIARAKGRNPFAFFALGMVSSVVGLAVALVVPARKPDERTEPRSPKPGS